MDATFDVGSGKARLESYWHLYIRNNLLSFPRGRPSKSRQALRLLVVNIEINIYLKKKRKRGLVLGGGLFFGRVFRF